MPTTDPVDLLLAHNRWATRTLLEACASLPGEAFHRRFEMGPGSLHDTLTHVIAAMRGWGDMLAGREQRARLDEDGEQRTPQELLIFLDEIADDFDASARAHATDEVVTGSRGGRTFTFARGAVLTHVTTHGMHHRAQCLNMLRRLGADPLPPSSLVEWVMMEDG